MHISDGMGTKRTLHGRGVASLQTAVSDAPPLPGPEHLLAPRQGLLPFPDKAVLFLLLTLKALLPWRKASTPRSMAKGR